jgi:hypothetical protein
MRVWCFFLHFLCVLTNIHVAIQGRDCLVQKFRNSSVMLEDPAYRPKVRWDIPFHLLLITDQFELFFTYHDNLGRVGTEDVFPASDNASKLKRSCENAEHVGTLFRNLGGLQELIGKGLFAPSAGQHMRDEQRRRRSQYDRGTSMAAREEIEYDPQFSGYSCKHLFQRKSLNLTRCRLKDHGTY